MTGVSLASNRDLPPLLVSSTYQCDNNCLYKPRSQLHVLNLWYGITTDVLKGLLLRQILQESQPRVKIAQRITYKIIPPNIRCRRLPGDETGDDKNCCQQYQGKRPTIDLRRATLVEDIHFALLSRRRRQSSTINERLDGWHIIGRALALMYLHPPAPTSGLPRYGRDVEIRNRSGRGDHHLLTGRHAVRYNPPQLFLLRPRSPQLQLCRVA